MLQRLPIALTYVKAGNIIITHSLNENSQIIYFVSSKRIPQKST